MTAGPMFHEEWSRLVHGLQVSLFHRLDRDNSHGGPTHRFADRFRISTIILDGLDVGLDMFEVRQFASMAELFKRPPQCCAFPHASIPITQGGRRATVYSN